MPTYLEKSSLKDARSFGVTVPFVATTLRLKGASYAVKSWPLASVKVTAEFAGAVATRAAPAPLVGL
jgi:hypothetical protein